MPPMNPVMRGCGYALVLELLLFAAGWLIFLGGRELGVW